MTLAPEGGLVVVETTGLKAEVPPDGSPKTLDGCCTDETKGLDKGRKMRPYDPRVLDIVQRRHRTDFDDIILLPNEIQVLHSRQAYQ